MFFYFLIMPSLIISIFVILHFRAIQRHDAVLFRLCNLRRRIINYLWDNNEKLNVTEYSYLRDLLELISFSIHEYSHVKRNIFNVWKVEKRYKNLKKDIVFIETIIKSDALKNEEIRKIFQNFAGVMIYAMLKYTPLLRPKFFIMVILALLSAVYLVTKKLKVKYLSNSLDWFKKKQKEYLQYA